MFKKVVFTILVLLLAFSLIAADVPDGPIVPGYCTWVEMKLPDGQIHKGVFKAFEVQDLGDGEMTYSGVFILRPSFGENGRTLGEMFRNIWVFNDSSGGVQELVLRLIGWFDTTTESDMTIVGPFTTEGGTKIFIYGVETGFCVKGLTPSEEQ